MTKYTITCDDCGYTAGPAKTPALAAHGLRIHSCDKQRARDASRARRLAREAAVNKQPKPCLHKHANHQHGTHACYVLDRCRCHPCTAANRTYERARHRAHAYGRFTHMVDANPIRDHIEQLRAAGLGLKTIAERASLSQSTLGKLVYGDPCRGHKQSHRVKRSTADKILAVQPGMAALADGAVLDGVGTRRRLQALMTVGWSQTKLAREVGIEVRNFSFLIHGKRGVTARTARTVASLYEQLWNQEPPRVTRGDKGAYTRSVNYARTHEFAPPLAWDDDTIDDPSARPDTGTDLRPGGKHVHIDDIEWLLQHDPLATAQQLAHRLGVGRDAIQMALRRADPPRQDLLNQLTRNADLAHPGQANRKAAA